MTIEVPETKRCPLCGFLCRRIGEDTYSGDVWQCCNCQLKYSSGIGEPTNEIRLACANKKYPAWKLLEETWWRGLYYLDTGKSWYDEIARTGKRIKLTRTIHRVNRYVTPETEVWLTPIAAVAAWLKRVEGFVQLAHEKVKNESD